MKTLFLLLLFCHVSSSVKHTLNYFVTASSGVPNFPEFVAAGVFDGHLVGYCDSIRKKVEPKQEWMERLLKNVPQASEKYKAECFETRPNVFKATLYSLKQRFNQSGGVHIIQVMTGCAWDDETKEIQSFLQYGYDGEDFISLDMKTFKWIAPKQQAVSTKLKWDAEEAEMKINQEYLTQFCPEELKRYLAYGKSSLQRTELPSVFLLQKTPSSPVSCHASGFYPNRASLIWRKDGEELHEGVDLGEILPNHDGTFQMSADLNVSAVTPENWGKYECVFHLPGVKDDVVTRLDKAAIRTNGEKPGDVLITAAAVVLSLILIITVVGFIVYKMKKVKPRPSPAADSSELTESLNPET